MKLLSNILFLGKTLVKRMDSLNTKNIDFDFLQDIFLEETWKNIDKIDAFLDSKYPSHGEVVIDKEEGNKIFRILHSVKGSAFMMGHQTIAEMVHGAEDLFSYLQEEDHIEQEDLQTILRLTKIVSSCVKRELKRMETGDEVTDFGWAIVKRIKNFLEHVEGDEMDPCAETMQYTRKGRKMIPFENFESLLQKAERLVRVMGRELGKKVQIQMIGTETEVPKDIYEKVSMAVMQMVKNSMDHGIEQKQEREALGKSPIGRIRIEIKRASQKVFVAFYDDGKGLNREEILSIAEKKGVLKKEKQDYTDQEAYRFLLKPGFTTKSKISLFSGRGVGLDVVNAGVGALGGKIDIESREHMGTTFLMEFPLV